MQTFLMIISFYVHINELNTNLFIFNKLFFINYSKIFIIYIIMFNMKFTYIYIINKKKNSYFFKVISKIFILFY